MLANSKSSSLKKKAMLFWSSKVGISDDDKKKCELCLENFSHKKGKKADFLKMKTCSHRSCYSCLHKWIEQLELSGNTKGPPPCPFCRQEMDPEDVFLVLGRPFQPRTATASVLNDDTDDLTRDWLGQHTKPCPHCGAQIMKVEETCDLMECLCGFRFCFACGSSNAQCSCTPAYHCFYENCLSTDSSDASRYSEKQEAALMDELENYGDKKKSSSVRTEPLIETQTRLLPLSLNRCSSKDEEVLQDKEVNEILFENMGLVRSWHEWKESNQMAHRQNWDVCQRSTNDLSISTCSASNQKNEERVDEEQYYFDATLTRVTLSPCAYSSSTKRNHQEALQKCNMHLFGFH